MIHFPNTQIACILPVCVRPQKTTNSLAVSKPRFVPSLHRQLETLPLDRKREITAYSVEIQFAMKVLLHNM